MELSRIIRVNGESFEWLFTDDKQGGGEYSSLLVTPSDSPRSKLTVKFFLKGQSITHEMLSSGFIATKNGTNKIISLTQPQLIAEVITYMIEHKEMDFSKRKRLLENGEELLNEMGYLF